MDTALHARPCTCASLHVHDGVRTHARTHARDTLHNLAQTESGPVALAGCVVRRVHLQARCCQAQCW